jgi:hypothetical protein
MFVVRLSGKSTINLGLWLTEDEKMVRNVLHNYCQVKCHLPVKMPSTLCQLRENEKMVRNVLGPAGQQA